MFTIVLFLICFCFACVLQYEPEAENLTTTEQVDSFNRFYEAVKEVFAPEIEDINVKAEIDISISAAQTDTGIFACPILVTPATVESPKHTSQFTIRQLRDYVRHHNLQDVIKKQLGKSVNSCRKDELLTVLFA